MPKFKDLTGRKFGHLLVLKRVENKIQGNNHSLVQWLCKCDCGAYKKVTANKLLSSHTRSCGKCGAYSNFVDLTNKKFDKLLVVKCVGYHLNPNGDKDYKWRCKCDCGKLVVRYGKSLKANHPHSCGCHNHIKIPDKDMVNHKFGKLLVLSRLKDDYWCCRCDCGSELTVKGSHLRNGHTGSCGCVRVLHSTNFISKFEKLSMSYFEKHNITFIRNYFYSDLLGLGGNLLSYDFYLPSYNLLIEIQGEQHYKAVKFFGGSQAFGIQKVHDYRKRKYAQLNNINFLEIDTRNLTIKGLYNKYNDYFNSL